MFLAREMKLEKNIHNCLSYSYSVLHVVAVYLIFEIFIQQTECVQEFGKACFRYKTDEMVDVTRFYGLDRFCVKHNNHYFCKWWTCAKQPKKCTNRSPGNNCLYCAGTCNIHGKIYKVGDTLWHPDGKNTCVCGRKNRVSKCSQKRTNLRTMCNNNRDKPDRLLRQGAARAHFILMNPNEVSDLERSRFLRKVTWHSRPIKFAFFRRRGNQRTHFPSERSKSMQRLQPIFKHNSTFTNR